MNRLAALRMRAKQGFYFALSGIYGFDPWHYRVVRENCRYFEKVRALHSGLLAQATIEVGCGLGEIISALNSPIRIGIDRDPSVIKAARVVRGRTTRFFVDTQILNGTWAARDLGTVCMICLNWFHTCAPDELERTIRTYVGRIAPQYVIFDVIDGAMPGYRYKHAPDVLAAFGNVAAIEDSGDGIRKLVVLRTDR